MASSCFTWKRCTGLNIAKTTRRIGCIVPWLFLKHVFLWHAHSVLLSKLYKVGVCCYPSSQGNCYNQTQEMMMMMMQFHVDIWMPMMVIVQRGKYPLQTEHVHCKLNRLELFFAAHFFSPIHVTQAFSTAQLPSLPTVSTKQQVWISFLTSEHPGKLYVHTHLVLNDHKRTTYRLETQKFTSQLFVCLFSILVPFENVVITSDIVHVTHMAEGIRKSTSQRSISGVYCPFFKFLIQCLTFSLQFSILH